jgi:uncharacterized protein YlxP (DUF503 family)
MQVGMCKVRLHLPENQSLKEKRRILKSIITRSRNSYSVSVSEVEDQDSWQLATLGIAYATNSKPQANEVLSKVVEFIRCGRFEVEIIDVEMEIVSF